MDSALEDGGSADLEGGAAGGDHQAHVGVAVVHDLGDAVMQEADAHDALTGTNVLAGAGAGLGVDLDVLVQVDQVLDALVMAHLLDHGVDNQLGGTGGVVVGQPDLALVLFLQQVSPVSGCFLIQAGQLVGVDHEAQDALIDTEPVVVGVLVHVANQVGSVNSRIGLQQAFRRAHVVGIGGAAEPDIGGGVAVLFFDLGLHLTGGQTLIGGLDAEQLLEVLAGSGQILFLAGAVNHQLALGLSVSDQLIHTGEILRILRSIAVIAALLGVVVAAAAGYQRQSHDQRQQKCKKLLHTKILHVNFSRRATLARLNSVIIVRLFRFVNNSHRESGNVFGDFAHLTKILRLLWQNDHSRKKLLLQSRAGVVK